jgi:Domain of unknown function (DUF4159)
MVLPPITRRVLPLVALLAATVCFAQGFGRRSIQQNEPPATEFVAARWHFGTNGAIGHMGWSHNYPQSDQHLNAFLMRVTRLDVEESSYRIVELGSDEVFDYPFAYVSEPGEMELTPEEVDNLREFVARGGFILMDDKYAAPFPAASFCHWNLIIPYSEPMPRSKRWRTWPITCPAAASLTTGCLPTQGSSQYSPGTTMIWPTSGIGTVMAACH